MFNGEEWEHELTVVEEVPPAVVKKAPPPPFDTFDLGNLPTVTSFLSSRDNDLRPVTVEVDLPSMELRTVSGIEFHSSTERVERRRLEMRNGDDDPF